jgi:enoyl-CoA hydratase
MPGKTVKQRSEERAWIKKCFGAPTVEDILVALERQTNPDADVALEGLKKKSPTSLKITLAALRNGRKLNDLAASLRQEFRIAQVCVQEHDFVEGVRAAIIDKDRQPAWRPQRLEEVTAHDVQRYLGEPGVGELDLAFDCLRRTA